MRPRAAGALVVDSWSLFLDPLLEELEMLLAVSERQQLRNAIQLLYNKHLPFPYAWPWCTRCPRRSILSSPTYMHICTNWLCFANDVAANLLVLPAQGFHNPKPSTSRALLLCTASRTYRLNCCVRPAHGSSSHAAPWQTRERPLWRSSHRTQSGTSIRNLPTKKSQKPKHKKQQRGGKILNVLMKVSCNVMLGG